MDYLVQPVSLVVKQTKKYPLKRTCIVYFNKSFVYKPGPGLINRASSGGHQSSFSHSQSPVKPFRNGSKVISPPSDFRVIAQNNVRNMAANMSQNQGQVQNVSHSEFNTNRNTPHRVSMRPPPPPSEPAPPNVLRMNTAAVRLPIAPIMGANNPGTHYGGVQLRNNAQDNLAEILRTPSSGVSGEKRSSLNRRPAPGAGRPKPKPKPKAVYPQCRALYDYEAHAVDELSFRVGDILEIVKEGDFSKFWLHYT